MKNIIRNRKNQKIVVLPEIQINPKGLAIVMHGLGGNKEQKHILAFAEAFKEKGYTVVTFDTTNTFGESDGRYEDATLTTYYEDLEDLICWAKTQSWFIEPFVLAGHSFGGISIVLYAEKHPSEVKALAPISTVISGELSLLSEKHKRVIDEWKKSGWRIEESTTVPGRIKRLPWSHMEDRLKYDALPQAYKLTMPVLLIVGENDDGTPPEHHSLLFSKLPGKKEMHLIKDAPHTFMEDKHISEVKNIFLEWIDKINTI